MKFPDKRTIRLVYGKECIAGNDGRYYTQKGNNVQTIFPDPEGWFMLDWEFGFVNVEIVF